MRTVTYSLTQLLAEAKRGSFVIPAFQRQFVWKKTQLKLLIDSIARNYPIGSLLLLQESDPNDRFLKSRPISAELNDANSTDTSTAIDTPVGAYYVLDGQQRLTSLVRVFLQAEKNQKYYFDLAKLIQFNGLDTEPSSWVISRGSGVNLPLQYVPTDLIFDGNKASVRVQQYFTEEQIDSETKQQQFEHAANVSAIFEIIRNFQIPLVIIERKDSTEAICRIFETINSTGTRLTTFDLAVARYFPTPDLTNLWAQAREDNRILVDFEAEGERALQVVALMDGFDSKQYFEASRSVLLSIPKHSIEKEWVPAVSSLSKAYEWASRLGATPGMIANEALFVPIAFFFSIIDSGWKSKHPGYEDFLKKWYFANLLQQGAKQAGNYRVAQATRELWNWHKSGKTPEIPTVQMSTNDILNFSKSDNRYKALHALLRHRIGQDLWTSERLDYNNVEDHHLFPAAIHKRNGVPKKLLDSIANRILVSRDTNRNLGDRLPGDYFNELLLIARKQGTPEALKDRLERACIPEWSAGDLDTSNCQAFLYRRAEQILDAVKQLIGASLESREGDLDQDE